MDEDEETHSCDLSFEGVSSHSRNDLCGKTFRSRRFYKLAKRYVRPTAKYHDLFSSTAQFESPSFLSFAHEDLKYLSH